MLLDTHVVLWLVTSSPRLGRTASEQIRTTAPVFYSAISITEIRVKQMLGRLEAPDNLVDRLADQGLVALSMTARHADRILEFPELTRHDPFDRFLLAQAAEEQVPLLTADRRLLDLGLSWVMNAAH